MYVCMYVCVYVCMYVCMYIYIYIHVNIYIYIYICGIMTFFARRTELSRQECDMRAKPYIGL